MDIQGQKADSVQKVNSKNYEDPHQSQISWKAYLVDSESVRYLHLKSRIEEAENKFRILMEAQFRVIEKLSNRRWDRDCVANLNQRNITLGYWYERVISRKKREIGLLQDAIKEGNSPNKTTEETPTCTCPRLDEINFHIKHGSKSLAAERKLLTKIKEADEERDKTALEVSLKPSILRSRTVGTEKANKEQIKFQVRQLHRLEMEKQMFDDNLKRNKAGEEIKNVEADIARLKRELERIKNKKYEVYEFSLRLKMQCDEVVRSQTLNLSNEASKWRYSKEEQNEVSRVPKELKILDRTRDGKFNKKFQHRSQSTELIKVNEKIEKFAGNWYSYYYFKRSYSECLCG